MSTESQAQAEIRERLLARQRELAERMHRLSDDRHRVADPLSPDAPDRAIQEENDEVVDSISAAAGTESRAIAAALLRLDEGRYGVCESCGSAIGAKRLAAVPYADQCQSCVAQANS